MTKHKIEVALVHNVIGAIKPNDRRILRRASGVSIPVKATTGDKDWELSFPSFPGNLLQLTRLNGQRIEYQFIPLEIGTDAVKVVHIRAALVKILGGGSDANSTART